MALATQDFDTIRRIVRDRSAIVLEPGKEYLVESRLQPVAQKLGLADLRALATAMSAAPNGPVTAEVVEAMTTNETSFFRDIKPFETLREHILPELVRARQNERRLTIWSAACSTGQEPYSLAMTLAEHFPQLASWQVRIIGTDISTGALAQARAASYSQLQVNRGVPAPMLLKHFDRKGMHWHVKPDLRSRVEFMPMNLVAPWPDLPRFDLVLLRNVLIYFDSDVRRQILERLHRSLAGDGYLMLGSTESMLGITVPYERVVLGSQSALRPIQSPKPTIGQSRVAVPAAKELR